MSELISNTKLLTDVKGVLDDMGNLIPKMDANMARNLIKSGTIKGGMIPKVETCLAAVDGGVDGSVILDGRVPHAMLLEVLTDQAYGTMISSR